MKQVTWMIYISNDYPRTDFFVQTSMEFIHTNIQFFIQRKMLSYAPLSNIPIIQAIRTRKKIWLNYFCCQSYFFVLLFRSLIITIRLLFCDPKHIHFNIKVSLYIPRDLCQKTIFDVTLYLFCERENISKISIRR